MHIYQGAIELMDYVFYATVERGKVYETGAFLHNYALTYALRLVESPTYTYANSKQEPHYVEELTPLNKKLYITPGAPQQVTYRLVQWNTIREGYAFPGKERSIGYPDWGFARVLCPGSRFDFYILVDDFNLLPEAPALRGLLEGKESRVRLGKFLGKARLGTEKATKVVEKIGDFDVKAYLNWRDLGKDPQVCDVVATSLPTRLLSRAQFIGVSYYEAHFDDKVVRLPSEMHFLARQPR